jgi:hypothetical protein
LLDVVAFIQRHRLRATGATIGFAVPLATCGLALLAQRLGPPGSTVLSLVLFASVAGVLVGPIVGAAQAYQVVQDGRPIRAAAIVAIIAAIAGVLAFGVFIVLYEALNVGLGLGGWPLVGLQFYGLIFFPGLLGGFLFALPLSLVSVILMRHLANAGSRRS